MKKTYILLILFTLTSCSSIFTNRALKKTGVLDEKSELKIIKSKKQKILFIPMHHVGREEYYDDVAKKIDSLQKKGFTVFYEGVIDNQETDSLTRKKSLMKLRKIMGFFPQGQKGYIDTTTNIIAGKIKYNGKHKLINQPKYNNLKVDSLNSIRADISLTELINAFEKKNGKIKLDSCDYRFSLEGKEYKCKKTKRSLRKTFEREYVKAYRNKYLAEKIFNSNKNKILIVYGDAHYTGVWYELYLLDKNYRIDIK